MEALLDPGPANFIPKLVNIYQQQAQRTMADPLSLQRGDPELRRSCQDFSNQTHEHNFQHVVAPVPVNACLF